MSKKKIEPILEQRTPPLSDLVTICKRGSRFIIIAALCMALLTTLYALTRPVYYVASGTFRVGESSAMGASSGALGDIMGALRRNQSSEKSLTLMRSKRLAKEVIEELSLQAVLSSTRSPPSWRTKIGENWALTKGAIRRKNRLLIPDPSPSLTCSDVKYKGEFARNFLLTLVSEKDFELKCKESGALFKGRFGQPIAEPSFSLTIQHTDPTTSPEKSYNLTLLPLHTATKSFLAHLTVKTDKDDPSIVALSYASRDRTLAAQTISILMDKYQHFIRTQNEAKRMEQIAYLEGRQNETTHQLRRIMEERATEMGSWLGSNGFVTVDKEIEFLTENQSLLNNNLFKVDLELNRLQRPSEQTFLHFQQYFDVDDSSRLSLLMDETRSLQQRCDHLDFVLNQQAELKRDGVGERMHAQGINVTSPLLDGLDLETADALLLKYHSQLDPVRLRINELTTALHQLSLPTFEATALSTLLHDSVTTKLVNAARDISLRLRDTANRTEKEQARLKKELKTTKGFLSTHIKEAIHLQELEEQLVNEKIRALQHNIRSTIDQRIAGNEGHLARYMDSRKSNLQFEKQLLTQQMEEIQQAMRHLPRKWIDEEQMKLRTEMAMNLVQTMGSLIESANISRNLQQVESTPIDPPEPPTLPTMPKTLFMAILGAFLGAMGGSMLVLTQGLKQGTLASSQSLRLAGLQVIGALYSPKQRGQAWKVDDQQLPTLRRITDAIHAESKPGQKTAIITGEGPDFSREVAIRLAKQGLKVATLECYFNPLKEKSQPGGVVEYLEAIVPGEKGKAEKEKEIALPVVKREKEGFFSIKAGSSSEYLPERLRSKECARYIEQLSKEYDHLLMVLPLKAKEPEGEALIGLTDRMIIAVSDDHLEELEGYLEQRKHLYFVTVEPQPR